MNDRNKKVPHKFIELVRDLDMALHLATPYVQTGIIIFYIMPPIITTVFARFRTLSIGVIFLM